jgi:hypothetical protein
MMRFAELHNTKTFENPDVCTNLSDGGYISKGLLKTALYTSKDHNFIVLQRIWLHVPPLADKHLSQNH